MPLSDRENVPVPNPVFWALGQRSLAVTLTPVTV
jgi:hypothetical protein